ELIDFCIEIEKTQDFNRRFKGYNVAMSSGTSGNKGIVITSPQEEKYLQAAFFARFPFPLTLKLRWAFILRVSTPAFNVSKFGQKLIYINQLSPIESIIKQLEQLKPNILSAPPSMLQLLAKEVRTGNLTINPKRIISYAEVLSQDVEKELEEAFGVDIFQIYQCSEGPIGMSCKHGNLHINEDLIYVQTIDIDGNPTPPGKPCYKMIVTDLNKRSQPIIRFELDDLIVISESSCKCGSSFRLIERILGRTDDLFWLQGINSLDLQHVFPDYIRRAIITSSDEIEDYQVIQKSPTKIIVRLVLRNPNSDKENIISNLRRNLINLFIKLKCIEPKINILFQKPEKNQISDKLIRIKRDFKLNFEKN
ncbi:MAG: AMP-binding protein, partial [Promethearchaeota archaeon]